MGYHWDLQFLLCHVCNFLGTRWIGDVGGTPTNTSDGSGFGTHNS